MFPPIRSLRAHLAGEDEKEADEKENDDVPTMLPTLATVEQILSEHPGDAQPSTVRMTWDVRGERYNNFVSTSCILRAVETGFDSGDLVWVVETGSFTMTMYLSRLKLHTMLVNPQRHANIVACWAWLVATQYHCRVSCDLFRRRVTDNPDNVYLLV
jgi:hypothetical protein